MKKDESQMLGYVLNCPKADAKAEECAETAIMCAREKCLEYEPQLPKEDRPDTTRLSETGAEAAQHISGHRSMLQVQSNYINSSFAGVATGSAKRRSGATSLPGGLPVVAMEKGDVFTVGELLKAAGVDLDSTGGIETGTLRSRGMVIVIYIEYKNLPESWAGLKINPFRTTQMPHYTYKVSTRYAREYRKSLTYNDPSQTHRTIRIYNGIRVVVEQRGRIAVWDTTNALVVLTASLGLLAVATTITELALKYIMSRREEYKALKFRASKDFHPENENEASEPERHFIGDDSDKPKSFEELGDRLGEVIGTLYGQGMADAFEELLAGQKKKISAAAQPSGDERASSSS
jgi:hypothetical protein